MISNLTPRGLYFGYNSSIFYRNNLYGVGINSLARIPKKLLDNSGNLLKDNSGNQLLSNG